MKKYAQILFASLFVTTPAWADLGGFEVEEMYHLPMSDFSQQDLTVENPNIFDSFRQSSPDLSQKSLDKSNSHYEDGKHIPTGAIRTPVSLECHPRTIEKAMMNHKGSEQAKIALVNDYIDRCSRQLRREKPHGIFSLLGLSNIDYDFHLSPQIEALEVKLRNGEVLRGIIGVKPGKARPLVIVKCGIFCDVSYNAATSQGFFMHLFDEAPFNVLYIANHTGTDSIRDNGRVNIGGFYEGQETLAVAKWLKKYSPWRRQFSDLHMLGISLGGSSAFYTALYNDNNPLSDDEKVFSSVIAYCPVVNLKPTMDKIYGKGLKGLILGITTWLNIKSVISFVPDLRDLFNPNAERPKPYQLPPLLGEAAFRYLSRFESRDFLAPFNQMPPLHTVEDFWERNQFLNYSDNLKTPVFVFASKNDWVVPNRINTRSLLSQHPGGRGANIHVVNLDDGNHCAQSIAYGWETVSAILRGYIKSHSNDIHIESTKKELVQLPAPNLRRRSIHVQQEWRAIQGRDHVELTYKTWNPRKSPYECGGARGSVIRRPARNRNPFTSDRECYEHHTYLVPYAQLPFPLEMPEERWQTHQLTRWLNSRVEIHGAEGRLIGNNQTPQSLVYQED